VKHGASVNVADLWKFTPLHEAAAKGKYEIVRLLLKVCHNIMCVSCDNIYILELLVKFFKL
jgi:ankyrin repeat protein